jgi:hypothetical protein
MNTRTGKNLLITMQVVANAILDRTETFDMKQYLEIFFENEMNTRELQMILERESLFNGFFLEPISDGNRSGSAAASTIVGTFFGISLSCAGFGLVWMWTKKKNRRVVTKTENEDNDNAVLNAFTFSKSYDTDECNPGPKSPPQNIIIDSQTFDVRDCPTTDDEEDSDEKSDEAHFEKLTEASNAPSTVRQHSHLMYTPALIPTESNIEVPDTPVTAFTMNGGRGGITPLFTPTDGSKMAYDDDGVGLEAVLHTTKDTTPVPTKRRNLVPQLFTSPFRREAQTERNNNDDDTESDDLLVSSYSGAGVVAGRQNNNKSYNDKRGTIGGEKSTIDGSQPPVSYIGGPATIPSIVDSAVSKEPTVDIVNEIAYMHSEDIRKSAKSRESFSNFRMGVNFDSGDTTKNISNIHHVTQSSDFNTYYFSSDGETSADEDEC